MAGRKLLKHELEEKVVELEAELKNIKEKHIVLNDQYELLEKQNTVLQTEVDSFERFENKLDNIYKIVYDLKRPTIIGVICTFLESILFNKPTTSPNNFSNHYNEEQDDEEEEEDEEDEEDEKDEEQDDEEQEQEQEQEQEEIVIEPPSPGDI